MGLPEDLDIGEVNSRTDIFDLGKVDKTIAVDEFHPSETVEVETIDEGCPAIPESDDSSRRVDEFPLSSEEVNETIENTTAVILSRIKVIGPRHPTIISGDITQENILTYHRRPRTLITKSTDISKRFRRALKGPFSSKWARAIDIELSSMAALNVWEVVDLVPDYKLVGTTWGFRVKTNHLKEVVEYKAWLWAQGFCQTPGVDFGKTYAPKGRLNSLRCLIWHAVSKNLAFHQVDVKSAFLNASLTEVFYLSIPQGLNVDNRKFCLCLKKAIYGLNQAPLAWYNNLKTWLEEVGFSVCISDPCVFFRTGDAPVWLYVHVDDIAIFGKEVTALKDQLKSKSEIKDMGVADLMLGIKICSFPDCVSLDQGHFVESLIELYGMDSCKPMTTPLLPNNHLIPETEEEVIKFNTLGVNFRSAVGSINYLSTSTRTDISHAVSSLSQFLDRPGYLHWQAFLCVLRYLKGTPHLGLVYSRGPLLGIEAYSDADWGNCAETWRSVTGFLATFNGNLVLWRNQEASVCLHLNSRSRVKGGL
ncbi:hypothetical protein O181_015090 [Austropuccinia psidii MF-1]|uniref:Reverse transcriptase Ty1/copia-type domain-containing protein n=1 Tax=Austropuccinia psidii MF-1 TaxID=1389203 RepID=A0A9Q3GQK4_9BASI|nr:hypothetical protein [Austropuccinia psidii MF-1]